MKVKPALKNHNLFTCRLCNHRFNFKDKKNREHWFDTYQACPSCKETFCNLPPTEKKLHDLQNEYLLNRHPDTLGKMYSILVDYAGSLMLKFNQNDSNDSSDTDKRIEHAHLSVTYLLEYYLYKDDFKIKASFAGYLKKKILFSLYGRQNMMFNKKVQVHSFEEVNDVDSDVGKIFSEKLMQVAYERDRFDEVTNNTALYQTKKTLPTSTVVFLKKTRNTFAPVENLFRLAAMSQFFYKGDQSVRKFFSLRQNTGRDMYDDSMTEFRQMIFDML